MYPVSNMTSSGSKNWSYNTYIHCLQVVIMTPEGGSWGYPYIKISPHRYPSQPRKGWSHQRGVRLLCYIPHSFCKVAWVLLCLTRTREVKGLWDRTCSVSSLSMKMRNADVITKAALSSHLFKDTECSSGQGVNSKPPAQQTGTLPTEPTSCSQVSSLTSVCSWLIPSPTSSWCSCCSFCHFCLLASCKSGGSRWGRWKFCPFFFQFFHL